jgi:UDP-N-acetylmuramoylalanine--D-glutamate ligase
MMQQTLQQAEHSRGDIAGHMHAMSAAKFSGQSSAEPGKGGAQYQLASNPGHAAVIGLGRSGLATAVFLHRLGLDVDVYDSSDSPRLAGELEQLAPGVHVTCGSLSVTRWRDDSMLVVSPGVSLRHPDLVPLLDRGVRPVGDVELFAQCAKGKVIAITGSNGKSTVTSLVGEILSHAGYRVSVGGNIGTPVLDLLEQGNEADRLFVLELSSFQLETTWTLNPVIATVLNIAADHMDRYRDMDEYIASKIRIYHGNGAMLINRDEEATQSCIDAHREQIFFSSATPESERDYGLVMNESETLLYRGETRLLSSGDIRLSGQHNLLNILAAWAMASYIGIPDREIAAAVATFRGLPHRMEWVKNTAGVDWINDSKGTNVGATLAAIDGLAGPVVLIAGGVAKDADFTPLRDVIRGKVKHLILIGRDAERIASGLAGTTAMAMADNMADAVNKAAIIAAAGDTVLLSPACASFDMYRNFEERGDDFRKCVGGLS